jgi:sugar/nucleoside kinase (ribokinase family)
LIENGVEKGGMTLIDTDRATALYSKMGPGVEVSGGSAANTIVGVASLGGKAAYVGKVRDDQLGEVFMHDIRAAGVEYQLSAATDGPPTARCLILVTPDAQRSMNTFLGASTGLTADDIDEDQIAAAKITYLEGYLFDPPAAKEAFYKAASIAHKAGRKVSLTLSDGFCVDRHRDAFRELVESEVDILFANESEIKSLYQVETFDEALQQVRKHTSIAALTRSEKGSVVVAGDEIHVIDPVKVGGIVDSTGAGDLYAAGFLYGTAQGWDLVTCGRLGSLAAGEVISHMGPRPEQNLRDLAQKHGLI